MRASWLLYSLICLQEIARSTPDPKCPLCRRVFTAIVSGGQVRARPVTVARVNVSFAQSYPVDDPSYMDARPFAEAPGDPVVFQRRPPGADPVRGGDAPGARARDPAMDLRTRAFGAIQNVRDSVMAALQPSTDALVAFDGAILNAGGDLLSALGPAHDALVAVRTAVAAANAQYNRARAAADELVRAYGDGYAGNERRPDLKGLFHDVAHYIGRRLAEAGRAYEEAMARMGALARNATAEIIRRLDAGQGKTDLEAAKLMDDAQTCIDQLKRIEGDDAPAVDDVSRAVDRLARSAIGRTSEGWALLGGRLDAGTRREVDMAWLKIHARRVSRGSESARRLRERLGDIAQGRIAWDARGKDLADELGRIPALEAEQAATNEALAEINGIKTRVRPDAEMIAAIGLVRGQVNAARSDTDRLNEAVESTTRLVVDRLDRVTRDTEQPLPAGDFTETVAVRKAACTSALEIGKAAADAATKRGVATEALVAGKGRTETALAWLDAEVAKIEEARGVLTKMHDLTTKARATQTEASRITDGMTLPAFINVDGAVQFARGVALDVSKRQADLYDAALKLASADKSLGLLREQLSGITAAPEEKMPESRPAWAEIEASASEADGLFRATMAEFDAANRKASARLSAFVRMCIQDVKEKFGLAVARALEAGPDQSDEDREKAYQTVDDCSRAFGVLSGSTSPTIDYDPDAIDRRRKDLERAIGPRPEKPSMARAVMAGLGFFTGLMSTTGRTGVSRDAARAGMLSRARGIKEKWEEGEMTTSSLGRSIEVLVGLKREANALVDAPDDTDTSMEISNIALGIFYSHLSAMDDTVSNPDEIEKSTGVWDLRAGALSDGDASTVRAISALVTKLNGLAGRERTRERRGRDARDAAAKKKADSEKIVADSKQLWNQAGAIERKMAEQGGRPPSDWYSQVEHMFGVLATLESLDSEGSHGGPIGNALSRVAHAARRAYRASLQRLDKDSFATPESISEATALWSGAAFTRAKREFSPGQVDGIQGLVARLNFKAKGALQQEHAKKQMTRRENDELERQHRAERRAGQSTAPSHPPSRGFF